MRNYKHSLIYWMYAKVTGLFWGGLVLLVLFTLANHIDVISPLLNDSAKIKYTIRGDVGLFKKDWKPLQKSEVTVVGDLTAKPTVLKKETAFVRLDYQNIADGLTFRNVSITLLSIASWWIWLILIYQLMTILRSIKSNKAFDKRNVRRIRILGLVFLVFPLLVRARNILFTQTVAENVELSGYTIFPENGFWIFPKLITLNVILGFAAMLLVFILAQVFAYGAVLKSENDLTV